MKGIEPAYTLLAEAEALPKAVVDRIYERMPAGRLIKTTRAGRFDAVDRILVREVDARMPPDRTVRVHDIAASNAITSVELFNRLAEVRMVEMKASDYYDAVLRVHLMGVDFVFDADGAPLQVAVGTIAMSATRKPWCYLSVPVWPLVRRRLPDAERISLFHPDALRLASTDPRFRLVREDFLKPAPEQFDVIRLANAVWPSHTAAEIRTVIEGAAATLAEGGLFVVGRASAYAIFVRRAGRFSEITTIGGRPEEAEVVRWLGF